MSTKRVALIVYRALHVASGRNYIGITKKPLMDRIYEHRMRPSNHQTAFQRALRDFGVDAFQFSIIDFAVDRQELGRRERFWIDIYDSTIPNGFNLTRGGEQGFINVTAEARELISQANRGRKCDPLIVERVAAQLRGRTLWNAEQRLELSKRNKGRKRTPEMNQRQSDRQKGVPRGPRSEAFKQHLSAKLKGRKFSPEHIANLSASKKGKPSQLKGRTVTTEQRKHLSDMARNRSPETRAKLSAARLGKLGNPISPGHQAKLMESSHTPEANAKRVEAMRKAGAFEHTKNRIRDDYGRYTSNFTTNS